jgi:hypothetical protein
MEGEKRSRAEEDPFLWNYYKYIHRLLLPFNSEECLLSASVQQKHLKA